MEVMCPHCGKLFNLSGMPRYPLMPYHPDPDTVLECEGSEQICRTPWADRRPLWNGKPNPHLDAEGHRK